MVRAYFTRSSSASTMIRTSSLNRVLASPRGCEHGPGRPASNGIGFAHLRGKFIYFVTFITSDGIIVTKKIRLGPHETRLLFGLEALGSDLFTLRDARRLLRSSAATAAAVLYRLRKKGRVVEVRRGHYLLVPARAGLSGAWSENLYRVIDATVRSDYYVGFWAAMNYWGMTEQVPRVVHVVSPRRHRTLEYQGQQVRFVTMIPRRIFGVTTERLAGGSFRISDRERTLVDGLLETRYCGGIGEVAKALARSQEAVDASRLAEYVRRLDVDVVERRLGYLLQVLDFHAGVRRRLRSDRAGFRWLDASAPRERLGYSREWGLILNVDLGELREWGRP